MHVSKPVESRCKMTINQGNYHQQNTTKIWGKCMNLSTRTMNELCHMVGFSYGVCWEILNRKSKLLLPSSFPGSWHSSKNNDILMHVLSCMRWLTMTKLSSLGSSWGMKVGFTAMIRKQNNNHCSERVHGHQDQRSHDKSRVQQNAWWFFF